MYTNTNQICIAILDTLASFINDFKPVDEKRMLQRELTDEWHHVLEFIEAAFQFSEGVQNAVLEIWDQLENCLNKGYTMDKIREKIVEDIQRYITERILAAQTQMVKLGKELFNRKKHETIMVLGTSVIFDNLFKEL